MEANPNHRFPPQFRSGQGGTRPQGNWRDRAPRGPSMATFSHLLRQHVFLFGAIMPEGPDMSDQIRLLATERQLLDMAWEGGDEFLRVLMSHMKNQVALQIEDKAPPPDNDTAAALLILEATDEDLMRFSHRLTQLDWAYAESDDPEIYETGKKRLENAQTYAEEKGGMYLQLFNLATLRFKKLQP